MLSDTHTVTDFGGRDLGHSPRAKGVWVETYAYTRAISRVNGLQSFLHTNACGHCYVMPFGAIFIFIFIDLKLYIVYANILAIPSYIRDYFKILAYTS